MTSRAVAPGDKSLFSTYQRGSATGRDQLRCHPQIRGLGSSCPAETRFLPGKQSGVAFLPQTAGWLQVFLVVDLLLGLICAIGCSPQPTLQPDVRITVGPVANHPSNRFPWVSIAASTQCPSERYDFGRALARNGVLLSAKDPEGCVILSGIVQQKWKDEKWELEAEISAKVPFEFTVAEVREVVIECDGERLQNGVVLGSGDYQLQIHGTPWRR